MALVIPLSTQAGVISLLFPSALSAGPGESASVTSTSLLEMPLLSAQQNPNPQGGRGGAEIVVEEGSLVSSGPVSEDDIATTRLMGGEITVYTVREGDSLSEIADMFGVTTNTILWANDLKSARAIAPGDSLVILPIVGVRHVVKSGDTLSSLAKKYEGDAEEILAYNQLEDEALVVGTTVIIPGGAIKTVAPATAAKSGSGGSSSLTHPLPGAVRSQGIHGYNAVDLAAALGTPIRAAAAGEVIVSKTGGWNGGYGNYIVIKHNNGTQTLYAHNQTNFVGVGAYVSAGETIASVGTSGRSTGAHLHFEVRGAKNPF